MQLVSWTKLTNPHFLCCPTLTTRVNGEINIVWHNPCAIWVHKYLGEVQRVVQIMGGFHALSFVNATAGEWMLWLRPRFFLLNNGSVSLFGLIIYFSYYSLESNLLLTIHESVVVFQWSCVRVIQLFSVVCFANLWQHYLPSGRCKCMNSLAFEPE